MIEVVPETSVRVCTEAEYADWNEYLSRCGPGHLFHRVEWDTVFKTYGLTCLRFTAMRAGRVVGVLPLVYQKSLIFGKHLTSLPWFDTAGILADDLQASRALIGGAIAAAKQRRAGMTLLRQREPLDGLTASPTDKVLLRLRLQPDAEQLWRGFSTKVRNQVRKAEKSGLTVQSGGSDLVPEFYEIYSQNMRDLGSPPHSQLFFSRLVEAFPDAARIYVVRLNEKALGAGLVAANGDVLEIPWASSLRSAGPLCVNHMMYCQILKEACANGFQWFHFGRSSKDSGQYHFKKQWGAEDVVLHWYELDHEGKPVETVAQLREGFGWASKIWTNLPLWLARTIGPRLIKSLP
jgi:FemAB-related protein (PEP-CTERM system-associated)